MANTLTAVIPQLLAQGMRNLRKRLVLVRYVNKGYDAIPGARFSTVTIPVPSAIVANDVTPAAYAPAGTAMVPTSVSLVMDTWKEAAFEMTDADILKTQQGFLPLQAEEAIKALAEAVETSIFARRTSGVFHFAGTSATTPFASDLTAYLTARKNLNKWNVPKDPRFAVLDADAEANALGLRAFQDASFRGDTGGITEGEIGRKLGAMWFQSNMVPTHTAGTAAGATTTAAGFALGVKTIALASAGTGTLVAGDVITFANHTQTYCVVAGDTDVSNGGSITIEPGLQTALPTSAQAITVKASFVANLLAHRDAFAFGTRVLAESNPSGDLAAFDSIVDEESGLTLRLELTRQYKQWRWSYDILWGTALVRPESASYIAG